MIVNLDEGAKDDLNRHKVKNSNPSMLLAPRAWCSKNKLGFFFVFFLNSSSPSLQFKKHVLALYHVIRQLGGRFSQTFPAHDMVTRKKLQGVCFVSFLISVVHPWVVFYCSSFVLCTLGYSDVF